MEKVIKYAEFEKVFEKVGKEDLHALHTQTKQAITTLKDSYDEACKYSVSCEVTQSKKCQKIINNFQKAIKLLEDNLEEIKKLDK